MSACQHPVTHEPTEDVVGDPPPDHPLPTGRLTPLLVATFTLAGLRLGVDAHRVREALQEQPLTPVPHPRPVVSGLMNLRGEVVCALDLRRRLGLPPAAPQRDAPPLMNLVVTLRSEPVSLLVEDIDDVIELDPSCRERVPSTVDPHLAGFLSSVCQQPEGLLLILDLDRVLETSH